MGKKYRVQVFQRDGTFVKEGLISPETLKGTAYDIAFSADPEQRFAYVVDGQNEKVWILLRDSMEVVGSFGAGGHWGGAFTTAHSIATDSRGNIYVGETWEGKRVQRFLYMGPTPYGSLKSVGYVAISPDGLQIIYLSGATAGESVLNLTEWERVRRTRLLAHTVADGGLRIVAPRPACHEGNVGWENIKKGLIGKPGRGRAAQRRQQSDRSSPQTSSAPPGDPSGPDRRSCHRQPGLTGWGRPVCVSRWRSWQGGGR